ncbi:U6 snRNA phosphodiesterase 1 [Anopheles ziemanni]|uniref:U6 snRNA phosphodiesterase 1 n=1 Tax=Anopheles coustani TaxID=139045 RepID=UPI00265A0DA7|nr:U6 snRNA phosphodiesterase 1 [Anopheles coustani]XP_058176661.1 U6 snRNA phosphodiesterase 1 [Anopheles ziemanni]
MNSTPKPGCTAKLPSPALTVVSNTDESELNDSTKHDGRKRSFPHERGIWASYVFVDCSHIDGLRGIQQECKTFLDTGTTIDFRLVDHLHLSLTKTFTIHHHNIASLVDNLQELLTVQKNFRLEYDGLEVYVNEERTRTFLGVRVAPSCCDTLETLVTSLDECMEQYKLPKFYTQRSFHVSILWCLDDREEEIRAHLPALTDVFEQVYEEEYGEMNKPVGKLSFKCGNKTFYFQLA